jgi:SAM-dependent methyltransferase
MLAVARTRVPRSVRLKQARAESPPFRDGWFDRVVFWLVIHLLDRPSAFAAAHRLLADGGRACVVTFDVAHFERYWANRFFPSFEALDRERFPTAEELERDLRAGGFVEVRLVRLSQKRTLPRDTALERIRGRYISTLRLLADDEYAEGLERAERELPQEVAIGLEWLVAVAER